MQIIVYLRLDYYVWVVYDLVMTTNTTMTRDGAIDVIKSGLKKRSKRAWSVTGGRGTTYGWIMIRSLAYAENGYSLTLGERAELGSLLGLESVRDQGVLIPASAAHYSEYIARAEGRKPEVIAEPYWD